MEENPPSKLQKGLLVVTVSGAYLSWGCLYSVYPPLYPNEAFRKGLLPSEYAFTYGISFLFALLATPVFATLGSRFGAKYLFLLTFTGQALFGGILFAFLDDVNDKEEFLCLSYILRALFGCSNGGSFCLGLGMLLTGLPRSATALLGIMETFFGVGYMAGPAIGLALYGVGGFKLPFIVAGAFAFIFVTIGLFIPNPEPLKETDLSLSHSDENLNASAASSEKFTFQAGLKSFAVVYPLLMMMSLTGGRAIVEAMAGPFAHKEAGMSQDDISSAFLVMGLANLVAVAILGQVANRLKRPSHLTVMGLCSTLSMVFGQSLLGPLAFLPSSVRPSAPLIFTGMVLITLSFAGSITSTFARLHFALMRKGYAEDIATFVVLTGLFTMSMYLGAFLGPTVAGYLVQYAGGFRSATTVFALFCLVLAAAEVASLVSLLSEEKRGEYEKLTEETPETNNTQ